MRNYSGVRDSFVMPCKFSLQTILIKRNFYSYCNVRLSICNRFLFMCVPFAFIFIFNDVKLLFVYFYLFLQYVTVFIYLQSLFVCYAGGRGLMCGCLFAIAFCLCTFPLLLLSDVREECVYFFL